jgi:hypothetical protein
MKIFVSEEFIFYAYGFMVFFAGTLVRGPTPTMEPVIQ